MHRMQQERQEQDLSICLYSESKHNPWLCKWKEQTESWFNHCIWHSLGTVLTLQKQVLEK